MGSHLVQPSCRSRVTYSKLHRTLSRRVLNISREGDSPGSLFQCSVTLRGKKFFLMFLITNSSISSIQDFILELIILISPICITSFGSKAQNLYNSPFSTYFAACVVTPLVRLGERICKQDQGGDRSCSRTQWSCSRSVWVSISLCFSLLSCPSVKQVKLLSINKCVGLNGCVCLPHDIHHTCLFWSLAFTSTSQTHPFSLPPNT